MKIFLAVTNDIVTDQRVIRIATSLTGMGADITVIGRKRKSFPDLSRVPFRIIRFKLLFNTGPLFYAVYNLRLLVFLLFHQFDVMVANDLDTLPGAFFAARVKGKKLVFDSHELFPEVPELVGRESVKRIWEWIEKKLVPKIRFSYTVCQSIAAYYKNKYGIETGVFRNLPFRKKIIHPAQTEKSERIILYQGAVNLGRGLELVIDAMQFIEKAKFIVIGDGDITDKLKKRVVEKQLQDKVLFRGRIPVNELHDITIQADIGVSLEENLGLNYYYALPNKLFDYIQANIPVLVSDFPEMGNLVKKYDIGVTTLSRDAEEIADIIKQMLNDKEGRERWKNNLKKAAGELCWEKEEPGLIGFYKTVFNS